MVFKERRKCGGGRAHIDLQHYSLQLVIYTTEHTEWLALGGGGGGGGQDSSESTCGLNLERWRRERGTIVAHGRRCARLGATVRQWSRHDNLHANNWRN